jgi:signal transduction histidine kinase
MNAAQKRLVPSGEEVASHSIRANHELILDLCLAKEALERVNDDLPDIFGLMTADGLVVKGNHSYSKLLKIDSEDVSSTRLQSMFSPESWRIIKGSIDGASDLKDQSISLEVPIDAIDADCLYHWTFSPFRAVSERRGGLYSFVGKDITKLRELERKLANIFSAIPLGVLTINRERKIEWPYSAYTEFLLGQRNLDGVSAENALFGRARRFLTSSQLEGINVFLNQIGAEEEWYDMTKDQFPKEVPFGDEHSLEPTGWRGLSYNPIIRQGKVDKVLIVIEDVTDRVMQRLDFASKLSKEQKLAQLIFDLQDADPFMLSSSVEDVGGYLADLAKMVQGSEKVRAFCNALHGIKGVARAVNIRTFKEFVHEMESRLLTHAAEIDANPGSRLQTELTRLNAEWAEILKYISIVKAPSADEGGVVTAKSMHDGRQLKVRQQEILRVFDELRESVRGSAADLLTVAAHRVRSMSCVPLSTLSGRMSSFSGSTAKKLEKQVRLDLEFSDAEIEAHVTPVILEVFYHLITNSLDHGIESPEKRVAAGKSDFGVIKITCQSSDGMLKFSVADDGGGINIDRVRAKGVESGLIANNGVYSDKELWNLIISHGFSTATEVTETSGRGIGLDAVDERIKRLGGAGLRVVASVPGRGTTFEFEIRQFQDGDTSA